MRFSDLVLGLIVLAGGAAIFASSFGFTPIPGQDYGAETMPRTIGLLAMGVGLFLAVRGLARARTEPAVVLSPWTGDRGAIARLAVAIGLVALYVPFADDVGFPLAAFTVMFVLMLAMRANPLIAAPVALLATVVIAESFGTILLVPLPRHPVLDFPW